VQAHLDQLDLILGQQVAGLTAIKNWLPKKVELIKSHRLAELEAFNQREEEQVVRLQQAESQRQVILGLIARELELTRTPSLAELVELAPAGARERLAARRDALSALSEQIKTGQALVDQLLRVSLDFVHYSMDVFAQLANARPKTGYGSDDFAAPPPAASWLVNRHA
jgi:hypothetical protein